MREELYFPVGLYFNFMSVPAEVIPCQINQHNMLGIFFGIFGKLPGQDGILFIISRPPKGTGYGMYFRFSVLNHQLRFGGRTEYLEVTVVKEKEVRGRVYAAERAIYIKFVSLKFLGEPFGQDQLKYISPVTMLFGIFHTFFVFFIRKVGNRIAYFGKVVGSEIFGLKQLFYFGDIVGTICTVTENISFVFEVIDGDDVLIYGIINIRDIQGFFFFRNLDILEIADTVVGNITEQALVDELKAVVFGFKGTGKIMYGQGYIGVLSYRGLCCSPVRI